MAGRPTAPPSSARSPDSAVPLARDCSIARALEVVGEQWTLLIIRDVFLGLRKFDEIQDVDRSSTFGRGAVVSI
jgi:DNA-binding HxlR family transcriptional regulator